MTAAISPLPRDFCNTAYPDLPGPAELFSPEYGAGVRITAQGTDVLMVRLPGASADFVCIEPFSHTGTPTTVAGKVWRSQEYWHRARA